MHTGKARKAQGGNEARKKAQRFQIHRSLLGWRFGGRGRAWPNNITSLLWLHFRHGHYVATDLGESLASCLWLVRWLYQQYCIFEAAMRLRFPCPVLFDVSQWFGDGGLYVPLVAIRVNHHFVF